MTAPQVHEFLKHRISRTFDELAIESGLEINYSTANLDRVASMIEEYMTFEDLEGIVDEFDNYRMEVDSYE